MDPYWVRCHASVSEELGPWTARVPARQCLMAGCAPPPSFIIISEEGRSEDALAYYYGIAEVVLSIRMSALRPSVLVERLDEGRRSAAANGGSSWAQIGARGLAAAVRAAVCRPQRGCELVAAAGHNEGCAGSLQQCAQLCVARSAAANR